jgi:hypothetical protein
MRPPENNLDKAEVTMNAIVCPTCDATLPAEEIAEGWCETCGKRIPPYVLSEYRGKRSASSGDGTTQAVSTLTEGPPRVEVGNARPNKLKIFLVVFFCGIVGSLLAAAVDGFRSGSRAGELGGIAGVGVGMGILQALGLLGKKRSR